VILNIVIVSSVWFKPIEMKSEKFAHKIEIGQKDYSCLDRLSFTVKIN